MTSSPLHIAGLFEGPWVIFALVLASVAIQALTKKRQANAERRNAPNPSAAPNPQVPKDWEERLRRMLGDEVLPPPKIPPIVHAPQSKSNPPVIRPSRADAPRIEVAPRTMTAAEVPVENVQDAVRRFEQIDPAVMTPVRPIGQTKNTLGGTLGASLRRREAARQAFVAALVFGPPKGLEE